MVCKQHGALFSSRKPDAMHDNNTNSSNMDGIRKKMQSLKAETDQLNECIEKFENENTTSNSKYEKAEINIRDFGKKIIGSEHEYDETMDKLTKTSEALDDKEILLILAEEEVSSLTRRVLLMEDENKKADSTLSDTITKLAIASKEADSVLKKVKYFENKASANELEVGELEKILKESIKMATDNEKMLDELTRKLGVQEDELRRSLDRAELAESKLKGIEDELEAVGENMKQLEISAERATEREEKLKEKIEQLLERLKTAEARYEYGEMHITKLTHRVDDIEDEIFREKIKLKKLNDELDDTFNDMLANY